MGTLRRRLARRQVHPQVSRRPTGMGGLTYHSPSTGQFRTTVVQPVPVNNPAPAVQRYPSYFKHQLGYASVRTAANPGSSATTLGYLNTGYRGSALATPGELASDLPAQYDGFGPPYANGTGYEGTTSKMTSIAWLNRPFASPHELMMGAAHRARPIWFLSYCVCR